MQPTLCLTYHKTLDDVLFAALEFEAATLASAGYRYGTTVKEDKWENKFDQFFNIIKCLIKKQTKTIEC